MVRFIPRAVISLQRGRIIGWKFCQGSLTVCILTGALSLNGDSRGWNPVGDNGSYTLYYENESLLWQESGWYRGLFVPCISELCMQGISYL